MSGKLKNLSRHTAPIAVWNSRHSSMEKEICLAVAGTPTNSLEFPMWDTVRQLLLPKSSSAPQTCRRMAFPEPWIGHTGGNQWVGSYTENKEVTVIPTAIYPERLHPNSRSIISSPQMSLEEDALWPFLSWREVPGPGQHS